MIDKNIANHPAQRVGIFIDTQNLYHSARSNFRANVNYEELIATAVAGRLFVRAFAYVIKSEGNEELKFFDALEDLGIETRIKDLQIFHTGEKKADWDVGIAVDMIRMTEKLDAVVLVSGDGDFVEVVKYVKSRGVRVEIMAFKKTTSSKLVEEADYFCDLGAEPERFLINLPTAISKPVKSHIHTPTIANRKDSDYFKTPSYLKLKKNVGLAPKNSTVEDLYKKSLTRIAKNPKNNTHIPAKPTISADNAFGNKRNNSKPLIRNNKPNSSIFKNMFGN